MTDPAPAPAITPAVASELAASLAFLGPWGGLATLALVFGVPFVTKLIENASKGTDPLPEEWDGLVGLISTPGEILIPKRPGG